MSTVRPNSGPQPINHKKYFLRSHHKKFGTISPINLSTTGLNRKVMGMTDQDNSDLCTAFGEAVSNSYEQGIDMSPDWQSAAESEYIGYPIVAGADPIPSMQATEVLGSLPQSNAPVGFNLATKGAAGVCDWRSWPQSLWQIAEQHLPGIPYLIDGPYNIFDNCRSALTAAYATNKAVIKVFGPWYESWNQQAQAAGSTGVLSKPGPVEQPISNHRYNFVDYVPNPKGGYLMKCHMTQGTSYGAGGVVYFDEDTINTIFANPQYSLLITRARNGDFDGLLLMFQQILHFFSQRLSSLAGGI